MPPWTIPAGPARATRRRASGSAWVNLVLLLAVALAAYLGVVWYPVVADQYQAKQITRDFINQAVKNRDDAALILGLSQRLAQVRKLEGVDEDGEAWSAPAVDVPPDAIGWERDVEAKRLRVWFQYEREILYPFLDRSTVRLFTVDLDEDITVPQW